MQYACRLEVLLPPNPPGVEVAGTGAGVHALELVRVYPSHEALWLYLRGAVALGFFPPETQGDADAAIDQLVEKYLGEGATMTAGTGCGNEAHAHAVRLAAWRAWLVSTGP